MWCASGFFTLAHSAITLFIHLELPGLSKGQYPTLGQNTAELSKSANCAKGDHHRVTRWFKKLARVVITLTMGHSMVGLKLWISRSCSKPLMQIGRVVIRIRHVALQEVHRFYDDLHESIRSCRVVPDVTKILYLCYNEKSDDTKKLIIVWVRALLINHSVANWTGNYFSL